ncbi:MAG: hypothetical protein ABSB59_05520 [Streptosporangiaceae bacterium]|jgi:hypothetical protein
MNVIQENSQPLAESGRLSGRPSTQVPADGGLVIENLNEFAAAGVAGACWTCIADFIIREPQPAAA